MLLPHESTVAHAHEQRIKNEGFTVPKFSRTRSIAPVNNGNSESLIHTRPTTPTTITHCHDEDIKDEDEDSDKKSERSDEENAK
jgi:5'-nucleotidase